MEKENKSKCWHTHVPILKKNQFKFVIQGLPILVAMWEMKGWAIKLQKYQHYQYLELILVHFWNCSHGKKKRVKKKAVKRRKQFQQRLWYWFEVLLPRPGEWVKRNTEAATQRLNGSNHLDSTATRRTSDWKETETGDRLMDRHGNITSADVSMHTMSLKLNELTKTQLRCLNIYFCYHDNRGRPIWSKQIFNLFLNLSSFCSTISTVCCVSLSPWTQRSGPPAVSSLHPFRLHLKVGAADLCGVQAGSLVEIPGVVEKWVYDT